MPAALPYIAAALVPTSYAALAYFATSVLVGVYQADRQRKKLNRFLDSLKESRSVTIRSPIAARRLVLGTTRCPGILHYAEFVGTDEEYFDTVQVFAHNQLDAVLGVYVGQEFIAAADIVSTDVTTGTYSTRAEVRTTESFTLSGSVINLARSPKDMASVSVYYQDGSPPDVYSVALGVASVVGNVVTLTAPYSGASGVTVDYTYYTPRPLRLQWVLGTAGQAAMSWAGISTPKWGANHKASGMAALRALHVAEHTVYATGYPDITLLARGPVGVYDPRIPGNVNGTSNPALLAAWYRTLPRADGGMGIPTTWIDWTSVAEAANICDELITVKTVDGSGTEAIKRYECNTVLYLADGVTRADNLRIILSAMNGDFPFSGGLYRCRAGAYRAPSYTITDADICADEAIEFTPSAGGFKKPPNVVSAQIFDKAKGYIEVGAPEVSNATYIAADGGEETETVDLPATTDSRQANYIMGVRLEQKRPATAGSLVLGGLGADILLLDTVQFNLPDYPELAGKVFEVRQWQNRFNGKYPVQLLETKSSTFVLDPDKYTPVTQPTPPNLSYLFNVADVANVQAFSGTAERQILPDGTVLARIRLTWDAHSQDYVQQTGRIEVRWKRAAATAWIDEAPLAGSATSTYLYPVVDNEIYLIEVRAVNGRDNWSNWKPVLHQAQAVVGRDSQANTVFVAHGAAGMLIQGDSVKKNTGTNGPWDAGVYSKAPIAGGCEASCVVPSVTTNGYMLGLNTDPTTDANYTSLDFALYAASSTLEIYESGSQKASGLALAAGDVLRIVYDNVSIKYYRNNTLLRQLGMPSGLSFYLDTSFSSLGGEMRNIQFRPLSPAPRGNLLDASTWTLGGGNKGVSGGGLWTCAGDPASEDAVNFLPGPNGVYTLVWRAISSENQLTGGAGAADGGWTTGWVPIEHLKMYRAAMFFRCNSSGTFDGSYYLGVGNNTVRAIATGTPDGNPYLVAGPRVYLVPDRWYLAVGYVLPSDVGTVPPSPTLGGVFDCATGQRVADCQNGFDYKWVTGQPETYLRSYQYYSSTGNRQDWWGPRFEMCDGSEPTIDALLALAKTGLTNNLLPDFESQFGLNGQFSNFALGASVADGWTANGAATFSREATITRTGPNAQRIVTTGAGDQYIYRTVSFGGLPLAGGSYIEGTCDLYLVSHSSGGYPGVMLRCFTNSGLSTYRDTVVRIPNTTTGGWQTIAFKAAVNSGEQIYAVQFFLAGSLTNIDATGTNAVVFDSLIARAVSIKQAHLLASAGSVTVTTRDGIPDGFGKRTLLCEFPDFTPETSGTMLLTYTAAMTCSVADGVSFIVADANATYFGYGNLIVSCVPGQNVQVALQFVLPVTGGVSYQWGVYAATFGVAATTNAALATQQLTADVRYGN